jgi:hypothetical protein
MLARYAKRDGLNVILARGDEEYFRGSLSSMESPPEDFTELYKEFLAERQEFFVTNGSRAKRLATTSVLNAPCFGTRKYRLAWHESKYRAGD